MKEFLHLNKAVTFVSLVGLILLLLLAPCKVRNSVQSALELPQTEVSNKSLCQVYEDINTVVSINKTTLQSPSVIVENKPELTFVALDISKQLVIQLTNKAESATLVPYYILYQNLKVHL